MNKKTCILPADDNAGFSLLETLVAFTILSLVTIAALQAFTDNTKQLSRLTEKMSQSERLSSELAGLLVGGAKEKTSDTILIDHEVLEIHRLGWSPKAPEKVTVSIKQNGEIVAKVETIMVLDASP